MRYGKVCHFAGDANLLNVSKSPSQLRCQINTNLKLPYKWLLVNKISLNCAKTVSIVFHKPEQKPSYEFQFKLNGHRVSVRPSDSMEYFGIYLDSSLCDKYHSETLSMKLKRANGVLSTIRHYEPETGEAQARHRQGTSMAQAKHRQAQAGHRQGITKA